ncbi:MULTISPECIES: hypothetical protein [Pseudomonas]|uniref:hypothetical protein n=1 Tax=Pseudomonas TaxID=286 RepID=UPI00224A496E|nr:MULTISPECIES: hypothetical protein [unclassified Pseudomonas]MCX2891838.1 hypothetical protein [Pseudomonas sp. DCB_BI]
MLHLIAEHAKLPGRTKALVCWSFALTSLLVAGVLWRNAALRSNYSTSCRPAGCKWLG